MDSRALGRAIRSAREAAGLSVADLSAAVGVSESLVSRMQQGATGVSIEQLIAIAEACGVTVAELLAAAGVDSPAVVGRDVPVRARLAGDPALSEEAREVVLRLYDHLAGARVLGVVALGQNGDSSADDEA